MGSKKKECQRGTKTFTVIRNLLFFVFLVIFVVSGAMLGSNIARRHKGNRLYREVKEIFFAEIANGTSETELPGIGKLDADGGYDAELSISDRLNSGNTGDSEHVNKEENEAVLKVRAGLNSLRETSPDIYGWIHVPSTGMSYPIVQGTDNEYYLNHAYNGEFSPLGAVYADYRCDKQIMDNRNTVFYGHNLVTGGEDMFHDVELFFDEAVFSSAYIYIYTFDGIYVYEPFSVYEARYDYNYYRQDFENDEEYRAFLNELLSHSACESDSTFTGDERIITLSTCTNYDYNTRYALHAKLINAIED